MRIVTTVGAMMVATALSGAALSEQQRVNPHGWRHHVSARHAGRWHGAGPGVGGLPVAPIGPPEVTPIAPPPRPYGGCMPTGPRYDSYGAYVAGGC